MFLSIVYIFTKLIIFSNAGRIPILRRPSMRKLGFTWSTQNVEQIYSFLVVDRKNVLSLQQGSFLS
jgi:hypothetical protein